MINKATVIVWQCSFCGLLNEEYNPYCALCGSYFPYYKTIYFEIAADSNEIERING